MGISTAGYIAISAAVAGAGYSVYSANKQNRDAQDAMNKQDAMQRRSEQQLRDHQLNEQSLENSKIKRARQAGGAAANTKGGTLLTSPLGVSSSSGGFTGAAAAGTKTLLGS